MKKSVATIAALAAASLTACGAQADGGDGEGREQVQLSFLTAFPEEHTLNDGFFKFTERLEEEAPWIEIDYRGGPETMAPDVMIEGVQSGAVDGAHLPGDYYVKQVPALELARFTPFTPAEERSEGVADLWATIHENAGLHYVGHTISGIPQIIFLNEELENPDLSGKSVRTSSATSNMVRSLGGTPVDMPGGEIFTALQRGVIDGAAWTSVGAVDLGIHEQVGYHVAPRFYESLANTVISQDTWSSLDSETQDAITSTMEEMEPEIFDYYSGLAAEETAAWQEAGVELLQFEGDNAQRILEIAYRDAWDELDWGRISEGGPEAEKIREAFEAQYGKDLRDAVPGGALIEPKG